MGDSSDTQWKGYSAYEEVASQLHEDVNKAIKAYSHVNSKESQNIGITPQTAVNAKSSILSICMRLKLEIRRNRHKDRFDEIYERWTGDEVRADDTIERTDEPGYIDELEDADLTLEVPRWLGQMVDDLIWAAWKLGYIRSGVEKPSDPSDEDTQAEEMFE